jgi:ATP-binding cassette, subfamily B, bacterial
MSHGSSSDLSTVRRLLEEARPFWSHLVGILLLGFLSTPIALLTPLPLKIAVDSVLGSHPLPLPLRDLTPEGVGGSKLAILVFAAALLVGVALMNQLRSLASALLGTYTSERLVLAFRARLFRHLQRLSFVHHDSKGTSDSLYRIQYDAACVQYVIVEGAIPSFVAIVTLLGLIAVTTRIDWQLALIAMAVAPIAFLVNRIYRPVLRRQSRKVKALETAAISVAHEVISALRVVKASGREEGEEQRFVTRSTEGMRARLRLALAEGSYGLVIGLTTALGAVSVLVVGVQHVQSGALTLGGLLLVMGYLTQLYDPLKTLARKAASLQSHLVSAERAFSLLDRAPDVIERPNARPLLRAKGAIELRRVSFGYDAERLVLQDISLKVPPGTRVGIAGRTGVGKTTLVSLLNRFYDPTAGEILLDGIDLREYRLADLRQQFSIVLQEPVLFSTTIAENIAYARPSASEQEIVRAARAANAHDFIVRLPDGYQTLAGERGMRLSGGERQRISLARAFLQDAPILILDEPTSSVDVHTEAAIMEAMERLMAKRTTFLITHRLDTLRGCDVLLMIEDGRLVETALEAIQASRRAPLARAGAQGIHRIQGGSGDG